MVPFFYLGLDINSRGISIRCNLYHSWVATARRIANTTELQGLRGRITDRPTPDREVTLPINQVPL